MTTIDPEIKEYVDVKMESIYKELRSDISRVLGRMDGIEGRMSGLESRMGGLSERMNGLDHKMDAVLNISSIIVEAYRDLKRTYEDLREYMDRRFNDLSDAINSINKKLSGQIGFEKS